MPIWCETRLPKWLDTLGCCSAWLHIYFSPLNDCSRVHTISGNAIMEQQVAKTGLLSELAT